ncbi:M24 family metallopeptidase [Actinomycetospora cinnamomea]|uniref:Xaa-Pro aminopeptidase n=1 Tax=Actinomycetospora cinnamomea TaxID=663609 RepID=A0A2U1EU16_9PSEU|nr:Xaa-Pro peptidase family protein [Actinomycetospora cinnamomea]PVZ03412.1 Xaa-Pro aminopeptidase [Actinomycetospora cinnamomea]
MSSTLAGATDQVTARLERARAAARQVGVDALVVTPGPDLQYLTGVVKHSHERLSALLVPTDGEPAFVVPTLERPGLAGTAVEAMDVLPWTDGIDPHALAASRLGGARRVAVAADMPALHVLGLRDALPAAHLELATPVLRELRMRKDATEIDALRRAGAAIDAVHAQVPGWLIPGRTEAEIGADITAAIVEAGHTEAAFVIVGSGPNGASPHHEVSDRVIQAGDVVVIDIGGPLPEGYHSDSTRTYVVGEPTDEVREVYAVLQRAQEAAVAAARPGVTAASVDEAARAIIRDAGHGEYFVHRTGHGIGLEVHEEPYIVDGNDLVLEPGMAFSVEPGIYFPGRWGARIEDIVVVTESGCEAVNRRPHDLLSC